MSDDARYLEGLRLYHRGQYWDSHEAWEELWHPATGEVRHFLQGLIQLDAALIHTERGHWQGVANLLRRALGHLEQCPDRMWSLDTVALRAEMRRYREAVLDLREGRIEAFDWGLKPRLEVEEPCIPT